MASRIDGNAEYRVWRIDRCEPEQVRQRKAGRVRPNEPPEPSPDPDPGPLPAPFPTPPPKEPIPESPARH